MNRVNLPLCLALILLSILSPFTLSARDRAKEIQAQIDANKAAGKASLVMNHGMQGGNLFGLHVRAFYVVGIDDSPSGPTPFDHVFSLDAKEHYLTIGAAARDGKFGGSETKAGEGYLTFVPEKGGQYRLTGEFELTSAYVWIEDTATGKRVTPRSHVTLSSYRAFVVPIIIIR